MTELATLNREQRRALAKQARRPQRHQGLGDRMPINPMFALSPAARNRMAVQERRAFDALLEHRATAEDIGQLETLVETAIRAVTICQRENLPHLDAEGLALALRAHHRAAWAIKRAKERHQQTAVYGLDAADRAALQRADELIADMRQPGVILRKVWMAALRDSYQGHGVQLPAFEEVAP